MQTDDTRPVPEASRPQPPHSGARRRVLTAHRGWLAAPLSLLVGCSSPNAANIELRKENQALTEEMARLESARVADAATIRSLEQARGTLPTLPNDRLSRLFTAHGIKLGRLTGGARTDPQSTFDDMLKVYVVPVDLDGEALKSAGSFEVRAFDLSRPDSPLLGTWSFNTEEAKKHWFGEALLYTFVLPCPLSKPPRSEELTVLVSFTDELTGRKLEAQDVVRVTLRRPAGGSTTAPATSPSDESAARRSEAHN